MSQNTKVIFSSTVIHKNPKSIDKKVLAVNSHINNYCKLNNICFIDTNNIKEDHLKVEKLHIIKKDNSVLASNLMKYFRSNFWIESTDPVCARTNNNEIYQRRFQSKRFDGNDLMVLFNWGWSRSINKLSLIRSLNLFVSEARISK